MQFNAGLIQVAAINAFQTGDFLVFILDKLIKVEGWRAVQAPAIPVRICEFLGEFRCINKEFFGNTATDNAGPAVAKFFSNTDTGAMGCCDTRCTYAARTGPNNKEIVVEISHYSPLSFAINLMQRRFVTL